MEKIDIFPQMISIQQAASSTGLPVHLLRTLIRAHKIAYIRSGSKKFWINAESLRAYLAAGDGGTDD